MIRKTKRSDGFTMLEILVVLAILLLGMSMLSQLMRSAIRESVFTEEQTEIQIICQNMMNRLMAGSDSFPLDKPIEIPEFADWNIMVSLNENQMPSLMGIQVLARKFEPVSSFDSGSERIPIPGQRIFLEQWVGKDSVQIRDDSFGNRTAGAGISESSEEVGEEKNGFESTLGTDLFPPDPFVPDFSKKENLFQQSGFSSESREEASDAAK